MTRFLLLVTMGVSLAAAAGCGASTHHSAIHSNTAVASDPSWCPPGEEFSVGDGRSTQVKREHASTQMKPNAAQRPTRGAVRAAIY